MTSVPLGNFLLWSRQGLSPFLCSISTKGAGEPSRERGWWWPSVSLGRNSLSSLLCIPRPLLGRSRDPPSPAGNPSGRG